MSKIFYDHLIVLEEVDTQIKSLAETEDERKELWDLVDDMVQKKVMDRIFSLLPSQDHEEFLGLFHEKPHDESLLSYLAEKIQDNIEEKIKSDVEDLKEEILTLLSEQNG